MALFSRTHTVHIKNLDETLEVKSGGSLFKALLDAGIELDTLCGGNGQCGRCKVIVNGAGAGKPTKRDRLLVAPSNIDRGMRLACQVTVRGDITVDTSESILHLPSDPSKPAARPKQAEASPAAQSTEDDASKTTEEAPDTAETPADTSAEEEAPAKLHAPGWESFTETGFNVGDGVLLVQSGRKVRYYHYSAGIDGVSESRLIEPDEPLANLIENDLIADFLHNHTSLSDVERLIVILDKIAAAGEPIFDLVEHAPIEYGPMLCEVLQPSRTPTDMLMFLRLLNIPAGRQLVIPIDRLDACYLADNKRLFRFDASGLDAYTTLPAMTRLGKNPVVDIDPEAITPVTRDSLMAPDSVALPALLKAVKLLVEKGIITQRLEPRDKAELAGTLSLDFIVKLSSKEGRRGFYLSRQTGGELLIDEKLLGGLSRLRAYLRALLRFAEKFSGPLDGIVITSIAPQNELAPAMAALGMIPQGIAKKVTLASGDPTEAALSFFRAATIPAWLEQHMAYHGPVELNDHPDFKDMLRAFADGTST